MNSKYLLISKYGYEVSSLTKISNVTYLYAEFRAASTY